MTASTPLGRSILADNMCHGGNTRREPVFPRCSLLLLLPAYLLAAHRPQKEYLPHCTVRNRNPHREHSQLPAAPAHPAGEQLAVPPFLYKAVLRWGDIRCRFPQERLPVRYRHPHKLAPPHAADYPAHSQLEPQPPASNICLAAALLWHPHRSP